VAGLPKLIDAIEYSRKSAEDIIRTMSTKYLLSDAQMQTLRNVIELKTGEVA